MTDPAHDCALASSDGTDVLRCACGSLLARYVAGRLELKCRRCKRIVTIPIENTPDADEAAAERM